MDLHLFRTLSSKEAARFRRYAQRNEPDASKWDVCHPVCREEWARLGKVPQVVALADRMLALIRDDVYAGKVPPTVATFAALHDHVDANEYYPAVGIDTMDAAGLALANATADRVDALLRAGALRLAN